jgi:hypothetical protein
MNIGAKNYGDTDYQAGLAKLDLVILGFYRGWRAGEATQKDVISALKARNPRILVGQYTILNEAYDDPKNAAASDLREKLNAEDWWARTASGERVQWTEEYGAWDVNLTPSARPDADGLIWPEWLARRNAEVHFSEDPGFDIWYFDNVFWKPRVTADFDLDGEDDDPGSASVQAHYREGHVAEWEEARRLRPTLLQMGNTDSDLDSAEFKGRLDGAFVEGWMGLSWSLETWAGWAKAMDRYRAALANSRGPKLVVVNVQGSLTDYRLARYGLTSALLEDGYFSYTDRAVGYSSVPWFDEYEVELGLPREPPARVPHASGVFMRRFDRGLVIVNPKGNGPQTVSLEPGRYARFQGSQDPSVNTGEPVEVLTLDERDGIILVLR